MSMRDNWRNQIALGWVSLLLLLLLMLTFNIVFASFDNNDFRALRSDPGRGGLRAMTYVVGLYAVMPILVYLLDSLEWRAVRWLAVVFAVFNLLFMAMHHLSHWQHGDRPSFNSHVLDLTYHLIGLWLVYCSVRWARGEQAPAPVMAG